MRHRKSGRKLGRTSSHYRATMNNLATALFRYKKIRTTLAKAKELRSVAEKLITKAKRGDVSSRRLVYERIRDRKVLVELFNEIAPQFAERNGGYTRVIKLGQRGGDAAEVAIIELVGFENVKPKKVEKPKKVTKETTEATPAEVVETKPDTAPDKVEEPVKE
ncbi:50S ribosomal protein L17 [candidate division KSB1 bacterium]|nr:50S ribosomal protein L17 [candidate division KSB1 bacterium]